MLQAEREMAFANLQYCMGAGRQASELDKRQLQEMRAACNRLRDRVLPELDAKLEEYGSGDEMLPNLG